MKKILVVLLSFAMLFSLAACKSNTATDTKTKQTVGVALPDQVVQRWNQDGANMVKSLTTAGYGAILQYANNDVNTQVQQCENMITLGAKVLVISAIDGAGLNDVCQQANAAGVKIIAYDRLITGTPYVDYYATFDPAKTASLNAQWMVDKLGIPDGKGPFNFELFAGDPGDNNAHLFDTYAKKVFQPYIDSGKIVIPSKQTDFAAIATNSWSSTNAQARMDNLIAANYSNGTPLAAVWSSSDVLSIGIIASLQNAGFGTAAKPFPLVPGTDCNIADIKALIAGKQAVDLYKDTRLLASTTVGMVDALLKGKAAPVNDTTTFDNGKKVVPTFCVAVTQVTVDNYKSVLIDSGYYTADQLA